MEIFMGILVLVLLYLFVKVRSSQRDKESSSDKNSPVAKNLMEPIRKKHQIYERNMSIEGVQHRKEEANNFIDDSDLSLKLEKEPQNTVDKNAIKIIGVGRKKEYFLGYVPKDIALKISVTNCYEYIYPRLIRTYRSEQGFIDITFQLVGLKDKKTQYDDFENNLPVDASQQAYLKFWKINYDKEITLSAAEKLIIEHRKKAEVDEPAKWSEWTIKEYVQNAYENFSDKDEREQFSIKKPTKEQIKNALDALLDEGKKIDELEEDYENLVEKLTDLFPDLQR
jgi:hypothetical protein